MRNALRCGAVLFALVGCGSAGGGGTGGTPGAGGGTSGAGGTTGGGSGGAGTGGQAGTAGATGGGGAAGANGAAGTGGVAALAAGTYAGTASAANCVGFPDLTAGCTMQITVSGGGPTHQVTGFMLPGGISGSGIMVTQTGDDVAVDLLTDSTDDFCPATEYMGSGTVGVGGTSMSITLTGPPCGSSDTVFLGLTLTRQ
ncbi:MAG TPA: hypothetical protein VKZ18_18265 [Polyangia bacterium]|nr:hypothetical protein [Polyangia bacterium]